MPWSEVSIMDQREEFARLARMKGSNMRALCRRYAVSPTTGYTWLGRYEAEGRSGLADRSRRPQASPGRTAPALEAQVLALRDQHPAWGGRKLRQRLGKLGVEEVPAASTITEILRRNDRLDAEDAAKHRAFQRFERAEPNELWQMDFKGHFAMTTGRCHPLTVLDDHSRYSLGLEACADERADTVRARLTAIFRRYGLPWRILADNGAPWGDDADSRHTLLTIWLLLLDIAISHGRPYHPQTQGKVERFHRSLARETLSGRRLDSLGDCQRHFDAWRHVYNTERPHQALDLEVPLERYRPSTRSFPETLPAIDYDSHDIVRRVDETGRLRWRTQRWRVGKALQGQNVAIRPTTQDGRFDVCLGRHRIAKIDLGDTK